MKKFLFIWLINLLTLPLVCSQQISVELFAQDSRVGMQRGYGVYYANYRGWGAGLVFQSSDGKSAEITGSKYPFYGVELRIPVQQCGRLRSHFAPRIGIVNRNFLVIIPEIQTEYLVGDHFGLGVGAGIRVREAAISIKAIFKP